MDLDKTFNLRKSVRKFSSKKPDWRDIIECIDAARYAPMSGNNYTLKFVLIEDRKIIKNLAKAAQQDFVGNCHYIVVACTNPARTVNLFEERAKRYYRQQAGAAIQNFLLKITEKGLATCWVGHFVDEHVRKIIKAPEGIKIEAIFPIGYELKKTKPKDKIELDNILYFGEYGNKKMKSPKKLDV